MAFLLNPKFPIVFWATGEYGFLITKTIINLKGKDYVKCGILPSLSTIRRHNLESILDRSEFPEGIIYKSYPISNVIPLNDDPSDPVTFIFNKFDGTMANPVKDLFVLSKMISDMDALREENKRLKVQIEELYTQLLSISAQYAMWKRRYGHLVGPEIEAIGDMLGKIMKIVRGGTTTA